MNINDAALRYLSSRSRSRAEMEKHLREKGFGAEEIKTLIGEYQVCGYLDDERYCHEYFRYAFGKGKGKGKVFAELKEKGIDRRTVEIAFEDYLYEEAPDFDERARAMAEAAKVLRLAEIGEEDPVPEKILGRIGRKLQAKGYSSDVIYSVIGRLRR